jgi:sulfonate transport system substrate-binding protein
VYLAPADGRAAFESRNVDAWVIWDPFQAAAEGTAHVPADSTPNVVNNYQFYLNNATSSRARGHRGAVRGLGRPGHLAEEEPAAGGELIAAAGLGGRCGQLALQRYEFNVKPITAAVASTNKRSPIRSSISGWFRRSGDDAVIVEKP